MQAMLMLGGALVVYGVYSCVSGLLHNIAEAKRSGFNYVVCPCSPVWRPWQTTQGLWARLIRCLPESWWEEWLPLMLADMTYQTGYDRFRRHGEAFLIVSPRGLFLQVANAEVIRQVLTHKDQFPKWSEGYKILRQFGENVLTAEGQTWRLHRKVLSPSFNERNSALVFREAIAQTQCMLRTWAGPDGGGSGVLRTLERDTMRLALHIISYVGFGMRLVWPGQTPPADSGPAQLKYASLESPEGHAMCFADAMSGVMSNILLLLLVPRWLLRALPLEHTRSAVASHDEYTKYMDELMEDRVDEARRDGGDGGTGGEGMNLMGQLVRTTMSAHDAKLPTLGRSEIISNAFIMFVAGHETTANTLHFALVELATNPATQRRLQREVDELVGDADPSAWDYDALVNALTGGMVAACVHETLRLLAPATELPREVLQDQAVAMDGRRYVVPRGTTVSIAVVSVHVNPRYWPHGESKVRGAGHDDLRDFRPERWFRAPGPGPESCGGAGDDKEAAAAGEGDAEHYGGSTEPDVNAQLFRPERGSYVPFSDGPRACLGRRIALVEMIAALAVLFREYSMELAVDEWAGARDVEAMGREARRAVYRRAQARSRQVIASATTLITLKLHGEQHVPVRLVRRGEERFVDWVDE